tara:strand:- start:444 stop:1664 length:1221 start_codon:yes stop_codon:yes gene_type:complete
MATLYNPNKKKGLFYMPMSGGTGRSTGGVLSITYSSNAFCTNAIDPTPTVTNNVGVGTFSSTTGLVFVSPTTGEVDISASTSGATYVITYTDTNAATATFSLTLNALDNAAFSYSASSYDPSASNPTPTITGLTGGTFSAGSGLVFVDSGSNTGSSTGEINLSASTIASYTITYNTASSGSSVCPNTSTQTVEIAAGLAQISNLYSMRFDGANNLIDTGESILHTTSPTVFSVSAWINVNDVSTDMNNSLGNIIADAPAGSPTNGGFWLAYDDRATIQSPIEGIAYNIKTSGGFQRGKSNNNVIFSNTWAHVVLVLDGQATLYINGVDSTNRTQDSPGTLVTQSNELTIGGFDNFSFDYKGLIDEVAIFNVALTQPEILSIYNATETGKTADLSQLTTPPVAWYRM